MRWKTERSGEFNRWWEELPLRDQEKVASRIEVLGELGPDTGRPAVDSIKGSRHPNMKELRVLPTTRVFSAFDPMRVAVLLIGGDKAGRTRRFHRQMVPRADKIYDAHLRRIRKRGHGNGRW